MWAAKCEPLVEGRGIKITLTCERRAATYSDVVHGWRNDAEFRTLFNSLWADSPFAAFRWETRSVTTASLANSFECVLLDSPRLAREAEPQAFAEYFSGATHHVVCFRNLGGDAVLVVPRPQGPEEAYSHLAAFVRLAPDDQSHALWEAVGDAMEQRVGLKPVWLSTAGAGVARLHVRLDDRPKYYAYAPYKTWAACGGVDSR